MSPFRLGHHVSSNWRFLAFTSVMALIVLVTISTVNGFMPFSNSPLRRRSTHWVHTESFKSQLPIDAGFVILWATVLTSCLSLSQYTLSKASIQGNLDIKGNLSHSLLSPSHVSSYSPQPGVGLVLLSPIHSPENWSTEQWWVLSTRKLTGDASRVENQAAWLHGACGNAMVFSSTHQKPGSTLGRYRQEHPGPASLTQLVSSKPVRCPVSKEGGWHLRSPA